MAIEKFREFVKLTLEKWRWPRFKKVLLDKLGSLSSSEMEMAKTMCRDGATIDEIIQEIRMIRSQKPKLKL